MCDKGLYSSDTWLRAVIPSITTASSLNLSYSHMVQAANQNLSGGLGSYFPDTSQAPGWAGGLGPQGLAEAGAAWGALQGTQAALRAHQAGYSGLLPNDPLGGGGGQVRHRCYVCCGV